MQIAQVRVQLLYETSGTLSEDITPPADFTAWNTIIGAGSAREPATDLLVSVVLISRTEELNGTTPLTITVTDSRGRVVARRTYGDISIRHGRETKFLLVPDATCAGALRVTATMGSLRRSATVHMDCGE